MYWLESVLLALAAAGLCALMERRFSRAEIKKAGIDPREVLGFHVGSLLAFGGFFAGVLVILFGNGRIEEPMRWLEVRQGAQAMLLVVVVGVMFDLWNFGHLTVASAQDRVNGCLRRWGLFWLLGFAGTLMMMFTGRPEIFFGFFAALKITTETWARIARAFGWGSGRPLKDAA